MSGNGSVTITISGIKEDVEADSQGVMVHQGHYRASAYILTLDNKQKA